MFREIDEWLQKKRKRKYRLYANTSIDEASYIVRDINEDRDVIIGFEYHCCGEFIFKFTGVTDEKAERIEDKIYLALKDPC
jgi:hypothetical protein